MSSGKNYRAEVRQPRLALAVTPWLFLAINVVSLVSGRFGPFPLSLVPLFAIVACGFLARRFPLRRRGNVSVQDDVLMIDGKPILEQRSIRGVYPIIGSDRSVMIGQRGIRMLRGTTVELASREDAIALIDDLKWDEAHAAQDFTVANDDPLSKTASSVALIGLGVAGLVVAAIALHIDPRFVTPLIVLLVWLSVSANMLTKVRVGTDGLLVKRARKKRFIPYRDVRAVAHGEDDVSVELISGETIRWTNGQRLRFAEATRKANSVSLTSALFERIENARSLFTSRAEIRSHLLAALKRDGRSIEEWRVAATSLSREHYRVAATPRDVLENIVQDSAVAPDVRIGAAIALHADAGTRVRVATETSALPELGVAIDAALDGDDPALEKAISTLKLTS